MLQIFLDNFMALAPMQLPSLINREWMEEPEIYDEYVLLTFNLPTSHTLDDIMDMFEEQMELIPCIIRYPRDILHTDTVVVPIPILTSGTCIKSMPPLTVRG